MAEKVPWELTRERGGNIYRQFAERKEEAEWLGAADRPGEPDAPPPAGRRTTDSPGGPDALHEHGSDHPTTRTAPPPPSRVAPSTAGESPGEPGGGA